MIWFQDISYIAADINDMQQKKEKISQREQELKELIDNLPYPVWLRTPKLEIKQSNRQYDEYTMEDGQNIIEEESRSVALEACTENRCKQNHIYINRKGEHHCYEVTETPFHYEQSLDKIATVGTMVDISNWDKLRRNLKQNQNAHLEILASLGTAIAVFDSDYKLSFYNQAFLRLIQGEESWLDEHPQYGAFLDYMREKRLLPEVPDYGQFRNEEHKQFTSITSPKEDLLHLPDGRSLRRIRAPHLKGGLIFAYEDITDRLTARREYNAIVSVQQEILNNIEEAVLIFASDGKLKFYNQAYVSLWDADEVMLQKGPSFGEILETQRSFFSRVSDWQELKKDILSHIFSSTTEAFSLNRSDGVGIECFSSLLSNECIMVLMHKTTLL